ncbi:MAG TPA: glycosyltransferase [Hyphomicrobium sp.]|nr:glycosyltransferase [Hyphomicrobium sp.]
MTRTVFIDPALKSEAGHHLRLSIELSKAANRLGHKPVWLAHRDLDSRLVPDFVQFVPTFASGIYERQIGLFGRTLRPIIGERRALRSSFGERAWEVQLRRKWPTPLLNGDRCRELIEVLRAQAPMKSDHLIIHSADPQTLDMLSTWVASQSRSDIPEIHVRTCWSSSNMPFADYGGGFANVLARLASMSRVLTVSAETPAGARRLADETGLHVDVVPHLLDEATLRLQPRHASSGPLIVGWLGEPRPEKGTRILPDIIRRVLDAKPAREMKFLLQCGGRTSRKARKFDARLAEFGDAVEKLDVGVSQDVYLAALNRCDILLLPYDPDVYPPERGSGAVVEALLTAKPIVATAGTFAASLITIGNGCIGTDATSLAEGLVRIGSDYECYLRGALEARDNARKMYDPSATYCLLIGRTAEGAPSHRQDALGA